MIVSIHKFIIDIVPASHLGIYKKTVVIDIESNVRKQWDWFRWWIARFQQKSITI